MLSGLMAAALALAAQAETSWRASLPDALREAKASGKTVLAEFTAPWCYSCYFMEANVFKTAEFRQATSELVLARVDVDQAEGRALRERHRVRVVPTFVLFGSDGAERGRIIGESKGPEFIAQLRDALGPAAASAEDRAVAALAARLRRDELDEAAKLAAKPKPASLDALRSREDWRRLEARLAARRKPTDASLAELARLNGECDLANDVLDAIENKALASALRAIRAPLEAWADRKVWSGPGERCADFRTGVSMLAEIYKAVGDEAARKTALSRAASSAAAESEHAGLGADRNIDDNRRYFLELSGNDVELERLYPRLVQAYPSDYVYPYRFAKWLAERKRWADALPWAEKAARLSYAANRLATTKLQAQILAELGRRPEAAALLNRDIKAYRKALPKETKPLEELLAAIKQSSPGR